MEQRSDAQHSAVSRSTTEHVITRVHLTHVSAPQPHGSLGRFEVHRVETPRTNNFLQSSSPRSRTRRKISLREFPSVTAFSEGKPLHSAIQPQCHGLVEQTVRRCHTNGAGQSPLKPDRPSAVRGQRVRANKCAVTHLV